MSKFLAYKSYLIDIGTTRAQWQAEFKNHVTAAGWQVVAEDLNAGILDLLPSASLSVGNGAHQEVLRFLFGATGVWVFGYVRPVGPQPTMGFKITAIGGATGASQLRFHLNNVAVSYTGTAGNTADQNLQGLFNALVASADPVVSSFAYAWTDLGGANDASITATSKTAGGPMVPVRVDSSANVVLSNLPAAHGLLCRTLAQAASVSVDFTNGFNYYLTIHERAILLSIKTTTAFYGPIYGQYADHAVALAQTPAGCVPVELVVGSSAAGSTTLGIVARITHLWAYAYNAAGVVANSTFQDYMGYANVHTGAVRAAGGAALGPEDFSAFVRYGSYGESSYTAGGSPAESAFSATPAGLLANANLAGCLSGLHILNNVLQSQVANPNWSLAQANSGQCYLASWSPDLVLEDIYTFTPTATSESLHASRNLTVATPLATPLDGSTASGTVDLADASAFPDSGNVFIGSEHVEYVAKVGNQLQGVTRAKYGTSMAVHLAGDAVHLTSWFVKINNAVQMVGTTKPV